VQAGAAAATKKAKDQTAQTLGLDKKAGELPFARWDRGNFCDVPSRSKTIMISAAQAAGLDPAKAEVWARRFGAMRGP